MWLRIQNLVQADQAQHRMELARAQAVSESGWRRSLRCVVRRQLVRWPPWPPPCWWGGRRTGGYRLPPAPK